MRRSRRVFAAVSIALRAAASHDSATDADELRHAIDAFSHSHPPGLDCPRDYRRRHRDLFYVANRKPSAGSALTSWFAHTHTPVTGPAGDCFHRSDSTAVSERFGHEAQLREAAARAVTEQVDRREAAISASAPSPQKEHSVGDGGAAEAQTAHPVYSPASQAPKTGPVVPGGGDLAAGGGVVRRSERWTMSRLPPASKRP